MAARRIRLTVRYDGTDFAGSQVQPSQRTVAGTLTEGLEGLLKQDIHLLWAGRTDSGVHADGNVAAFDADTPVPSHALPGLLGKQLPADVVVRTASDCAPGFHPRYDAVERVYLYRIYLGSDVPVDRMRYVCGHGGGWDCGAVEMLCEGLAGEHEFTSFCAGTIAREDSLCTLKPVEVMQSGQEVGMLFKGNRFLHNMICRLAGAILEVAQGGLAPADVLAALDEPAGFKPKPAPPRGLTLLWVKYAGES